MVNLAAVKLLAETTATAPLPEAVPAPNNSTEASGAWTDPGDSEKAYNYTVKYSPEDQQLIVILNTGLRDVKVAIELNADGTYGRRTYEPRGMLNGEAALLNAFVNDTKTQEVINNLITPGTTPPEAPNASGGTSTHKSKTSFNLSGLEDGTYSLEQAGTKVALTITTDSLNGARTVVIDRNNGIVDTIAFGPDGFEQDRNTTRQKDGVIVPADVIEIENFAAQALDTLQTRPAPSPLDDAASLNNLQAGTYGLNLTDDGYQLVAPPESGDVQVTVTDVPDSDGRRIEIIYTSGDTQIKDTINFTAGWLGIVASYGRAERSAASGEWTSAAYSEPDFEDRANKILTAVVNTEGLQSVELQTAFNSALTATINQELTNGKVNFTINRGGRDFTANLDDKNTITLTLTSRNLTNTATFERFEHNGTTFYQLKSFRSGWVGSNDPAALRPIIIEAPRKAMETFLPVLNSFLPPAAPRAPAQI